MQENEQAGFPLFEKFCKKTSFFGHL